jgi:hypothetical protein
VTVSFSRWLLPHVISYLNVGSYYSLVVFLIVEFDMEEMRNACILVGKPEGKKDSTWDI